MIAREKLNDYFLVKKFCKGVMSASRWSELFPCLSLLSYNKLDIHWPTKDSLYRTIWHVRDPWIYTSERVWSRPPGVKRTRGSAPTPLPMAAIQGADPHAVAHTTVTRSSGCTDPNDCQWRGGSWCPCLCDCEQMQKEQKIQPLLLSSGGSLKL